MKLNFKLEIKKLVIKTANLNICLTCKHYTRYNNRHGKCALHNNDTCSEGSCSLYKYVCAQKELVLL